MVDDCKFYLFFILKSQLFIKVSNLNNLNFPISCLVENYAVLYADQKAMSVVSPTGQSANLTFKEINDLANRIASFLQNTMRLVQGDVVALKMYNHLHYPAFALACWKIGLVITNINPLYTVRELTHQLKDSQAKVLVTTSSLLDTFNKAILNHQELSKLDIILTNMDDFFEQPIHISDQISCMQNEQGNQVYSFKEILSSNNDNYVENFFEVALYQYTGGTTGVSKAAILTHSNINHAVDALINHFTSNNIIFEEQDQTITAVPLYHILGFCVAMLTFLKAKVHNVLIPVARPLSNLKYAFDQFDISWMIGVETLFAGLLYEEWFINGPKKIKCALSGGTAMRSATYEKWIEKISPMVEGYGMTEAAGTITLQPLSGNRPLNSVGKPLQGMEVRIVNENSESMKTNEIGEILIRGPQVMQGYLNKPEENAFAFIDGWLCTGDIGKLDNEGYLYIMDRKKDMILVSGFNVFPNEIEGVLSCHKNVIEVAVVGKVDDKTGEAIHAYIVLSKNITKEELTQYCRENLTAYKVPKHFHIVNELPKNTVGKVLRFELKND